VGVAVTPDGRKVYVADNNSNIVLVIETAANGVIATIPGVFIQGSSQNLP
jgi:YVTN family beta-propeller protein